MRNIVLNSDSALRVRIVVYWAIPTSCHLCKTNAYFSIISMAEAQVAK